MRPAPELDRRGHLSVEDPVEDGDCWAALEPLRQGAREIFGGVHKDIARGKIRCDWGPQYIADASITEVKWRGMTISPSYVGEPSATA
jgi:hypothetical protein